MDVQLIGDALIPAHKMWPLLHLDPCVVFGVSETEECVLNESQVQDMERAWELAQYQMMEWLGEEIPFQPVSVVEILPFRGCTGHYLAKRPVQAVGAQVSIGEVEWADQPLEWWAVEDAAIVADAGSWRVDVSRTLIPKMRDVKPFINGSARPLNTNSHAVEESGDDWRIWFDEEPTRVDVANLSALYLRLPVDVNDYRLVITRPDGRIVPVLWTIVEEDEGGDAESLLAIDRCYLAGLECEPRTSPWDRACFLETLDVHGDCLTQGAVRLLAYPNCPPGICGWCDVDCTTQICAVDCITILSHKLGIVKPHVTAICCNESLSECPGEWNIEDLFCNPNRPQWTHIQVCYVAGLVDGAYGFSERMFMQRLVGLMATFLDDKAGSCLQCGAAGWVDRLMAYRRTRDVAVRDGSDVPQAFMSGWVDAHAHVDSMRRLCGSRITATLI